MVFRTGSVFINRVNVFSVLIERNDGGVNDEDVSNDFETSTEVGSARVKILDGVIENLAEESNESWFKPPLEGRIDKFVTASHLDVAFEKRLDISVRSGSEPEWKRVEQRDDVEFSLSVDEIRCASTLAQLIGGKHSLNSVHNY